MEQSVQMRDMTDILIFQIIDGYSRNFDDEENKCHGGNDEQAQGIRGMGNYDEYIPCCYIIAGTNEWENGDKKKLWKAKLSE